ncbi:hypothetical protein DFH28DRAFT_1218605 [Melampsora americana]|nr:hypothetical protein DFH28DRAFT_1218605 [Melampsora americana]
MDSTNSITNPSPPSMPMQHIPTSTPTPILNTIHAAESQPTSALPPFVIPTLSLKKRGRPQKAPIASQKAHQKPNALRPSQPPKSDTRIKAPQELQANIQAENDDETDKTKSKKCWFTPKSDGKSDIDLVAEWCSDFDNFNAWQTQQKNMVREQVSEYLVSKGHADRGGRECEKKILALVEWFRHANSLRQATGKGNQYAPVKFKVSKEDLAEFKWNKRRAKKGEEEEGSLQVRILCRCPWYKELEPVL